MTRVLYAPTELPPLSLDVSQDPGPYSSWVLHREEQRVQANELAQGTELGLVLPVDDLFHPGLQHTLASLGRQTSPHWSLVVVVAEENHLQLERGLRRLLRPKDHRRARTLMAPAAATASGLVRHGLSAQRGNPTALLFPGDVWAPDAVSQLATALAPDTMVYADEDRISESGEHVRPRLKPSFSPDFLFSTSYVGRPIAFGALITQQLPELVAESLAGVEHECALAGFDLATSVTHVPEVLCHRTDDDGATENDGHYLAAALERRGEAATVTNGRSPSTWSIVRAGTSTLTSILIPFRNEPRFLRTCMESLTTTTRAERVEFILIDNGSTDLETLTLMERLDARSDIHFVSDPRPFNWAALNNGGADAASGDVLVFMNNDMEAHHDGWLTHLSSHAVRKDVGAVGARLLYPDGRIQHCGVVIGMIGAAGHVLLGLPGTDPGYLHMAEATRECAAVTGACLATRREVFDLLNGFDEALGVDLNDVDFCLRAGRSGYRTIYEPRVELTHYESPSRGTAGGVGDIVRFIERWKGYIAEGDPYLNQHLTRTAPSCGLAQDDEQGVWHAWHTTVTSEGAPT